MKKILTLTVTFMFSVMLFSQESLKLEINTLIDSWHEAAAINDQEGYFEKIDEHGIYIGTDSSEVWTRQEFYDWSTPHFQKENGWAFKAQSRNVYLSDDGRMAWFDELLDYGKGTLRGSGVLAKKDTEWRILHYVLSVPVPNDKFTEVMKLIERKPMLLEDEK